MLVQHPGLCAKPMTGGKGQASMSTVADAGVWRKPFLGQSMKKDGFLTPSISTVEGRRAGQRKKKREKILY